MGVGIIQRYLHVLVQLQRKLVLLINLVQLNQFILQVALLLVIVLYQICQETCSSSERSHTDNHNENTKYFLWSVLGADVTVSDRRKCSYREVY